MLCNERSKAEGLTPCYDELSFACDFDADGYRLPTEAEWEFSCLAGTTTKYWIGDQDEDLPQAGWFGMNSGGRTHAVGELKANPLGLYDIHGNLWEWVQDWWEPTYYGQFQEKPALNSGGPSSAGSQRVVRGGDWGNHASDCRASYRGAAPPVVHIGTVAGVYTTPLIHAEEVLDLRAQLLVANEVGITVEHALGDLTGLHHHCLVAG